METGESGKRKKERSLKWNQCEVFFPTDCSGTFCLIHFLLHTHFSIKNYVFGSRSLAQLYLIHEISATFGKG